MLTARSVSLAMLLPFLASAAGAGGAVEARVMGTTFTSLARERIRVEVGAEVTRDLFWRLYWAVHALESFDSDPPGDRRRSDFGVSSTIGWSF